MCYDIIAKPNRARRGHAHTATDDAVRSQKARGPTHVKQGKRQTRAEASSGLGAFCSVLLLALVPSRAAMLGWVGGVSRWDTVVGPWRSEIRIREDFAKKRGAYRRGQEGTM